MAILHLLMLNASRWMPNAPQPLTELDVVIEVVPNQPTASASTEQAQKAVSTPPPLARSNAGVALPDARAPAALTEAVPPAAEDWQVTSPKPPGAKPTLDIAPSVPVAGAPDTSARDASTRDEQLTPAVAHSPPQSADPSSVPGSSAASYLVGSAKNPRPAYPPAAYLARIEGRVILRVHVMANGKPAEISLLQTSGSAQLDKSALDTLAQWELQPARKNGEPVDQWIEIPINFRILRK